MQGALKHLPAKDSKLYIENKPTENLPVSNKPLEAIAATKPLTKLKENSQTIAAHIPTGNKKNLLDALREKYGGEYNIEEVKEAEALDINKLREHWLTYAMQLEQQQKHSSANTFRAAQLHIGADNYFTVTVNAHTQQKFIEQERTTVADIIQQAFNNRSINFKVLVDEGIKEEIPAQLLLNSRQRFDRIADQYPLIRELKGRLGLDLDY